jgi:hypothetical protein
MSAFGGERYCDRYGLFGWILPISWLHEPDRRETGFRDETNLLASVEPGIGCFKYRASLAPHMYAGNQTYISHA